jgi:hypothetical protein
MTERTKPLGEVDLKPLGNRLHRHLCESCHREWAHETRACAEPYEFFYCNGCDHQRFLDRLRPEAEYDEEALQHAQMRVIL